MQILIADDEELERLFLKQALMNKFSENIKIIEAEDGIDALEKCLNNNFNLIIMDIEMPRMNGLDVVEKIRESGVDSDILISTAHSVFEYARKAVGLGIKEYLVKPYSLKTLNVVLDKLNLDDTKILRKKEEGRIKVIMDYIEAHYTEPITLDDISENVGLSRYYVSRILNQGEGKNLTALVNQLRIEKAKLLLLDGSKSNEVAYMLGYQDPSYFSKVFKKLTGKSPKEYLESNRVLF